MPVPAEPSIVLRPREPRAGGGKGERPQSSPPLLLLEKGGLGRTVPERPTNGISTSSTTCPEPFNGRRRHMCVTSETVVGPHVLRRDIIDPNVPNVPAGRPPSQGRSQGGQNPPRKFCFISFFFFVHLPKHARRHPARFSEGPSSYSEESTTNGRITQLMALVEYSFTPFPFQRTVFLR